jgi:hypothetical protein
MIRPIRHEFALKQLSRTTSCRPYNKQPRIGGKSGGNLLLAMPWIPSCCARLTVLVQALNSLVWLDGADDACECLISLIRPSDSSVETQIEASRLTPLSGRLQTPGSSSRQPPDACSHRIPAAKSRTCSWKTMSGSDLRSSCSSYVSRSQRLPEAATPPTSARRRWNKQRAVRRCSIRCSMCEVPTAAQVSRARVGGQETFGIWF